MTEKPINEMTEDEIREELQKLRDSRKKGYTPRARTRVGSRQPNPYADLDPKIAAQILKKIEESEKQ